MTHRPHQPATRRQHWLCIAYAFPPINRSGTHRTLAFVNHLDRLGWDATVLTVKPGDEPVDEPLLDRVPASTTVIRTPWVDLIAKVKSTLHLNHAQSTPPEPRASARANTHEQWAPARAARRTHRQPALRDWITRLLITPDSRVGWVLPAVRAGLRAIRQRRPDLIYSTSPCMSAHLIALILSRRTGLPWVADFRDPWRGNPFRRLGFRTLEWWDGWLEKQVLRRATHVVCNTEPMKTHLIRRRPFVAEKCSTIMNGFDVDAAGGIEPTRTAPREDFVLTHCGQFYGPRSPNVWFAALRRAIDQEPNLAGKIHMVLIGAESFDGHKLTSLAERAGVGRQVRVLGRRSHAETLSHMAGSDALMLAGSAGDGNELQVPAKLFEYLTLRKPIIATVSPDGPAAWVLSTARAEAVICPPDDERRLAAAIAHLATERHVPLEDAWSGVESFNRAHRGEELAATFARITGRVRRRVARSGEAGPWKRRKVADLASEPVAWATHKKKSLTYIEPDIYYR